ncbi:MAG: hypothetical protein IIA92_04365 [Chloroflexi bacterium]|nr:hypothetical protein [Chloroflexota bacterium]
MNSPLSEILNDPSLSVEEKAEHIAIFLSTLPDRGASECVRFVLSTEDANAATFPANYLALLPAFGKEKRQIVEHILNNNKQLMIAIVELVKDMPIDVVDRLIAEYLGNPDSGDMFSVIFEIANAFPYRLRDFEDRIDNSYVQRAILSGGPGVWVEELAGEYRRDGDPATLRALARFRTDEALDALLTLKPSVPDEDQDDLWMYIESSGVFPDTRRASVYFHAFRGFVVSREESPHHMGGGYQYRVPRCPVCRVAATRILTLNSAALDIGLESGHDPSFFWYTCPHPPEFLHVRFTDQGTEGLMIPMTNGPQDGDLIPGQLSLLLQEHHNQYGSGLDATPGFGSHQVGGYPPWIRHDPFPRCPGCQEGMRFLASIDSGMTPFGRMAFYGIIYGFWCDNCAISVSQLQEED